ncbi:MAG: hypothetical protein JWL77_2182 [Chthonomonadaceae bacterium]|nr:hypothetical protein [Chthonomonadaceae bacterium]
MKEAFSPDRFPWILWPIWAVLSLSFIGYIITARKRRGPPSVSPTISPSRILYQENFASGRSLEDGITRIGGAHNCLKLVVTQDELWVTALFPFSLFLGPYDLIHRIPKQKILSVRESTRFLLGRRLLIEFTCPNGKTATLELAPKNVDGFLQALGIKLDIT